MSNVKSLSDDFRDLRKAATPWCVIQTSDYRATVKEVVKVRMNGEDAPPAFVWTCVDGPSKIQGRTNTDLGNDGDAPSIFLTKALALPEEGILFLVVPDDFSAPNHFWTN